MNVPEVNQDSLNTSFVNTTMSLSKCWTATVDQNDIGCSFQQESFSNEVRIGFDRRIRVRILSILASQYDQIDSIP